MEKSEELEALKAKLASSDTSKKDTLKMKQE